MQEEALCPPAPQPLLCAQRDYVRRELSRVIDEALADGYARFMIGLAEGGVCHAHRAKAPLKHRAAAGGGAGQPGAIRPRPLAADARASAPRLYGFLHALQCVRQLHAARVLPDGPLRPGSLRA